MKDILNKIQNDIKLSPDDLLQILELEDNDILQQIYKEAYRIKLENIGNKVYFRGIIEFSNICAKNCYYCGIRKDNRDVKRFKMNEEAIIRMAKWTYENNYGSLVLQGGEIESPEHASFIEHILKRIKKETSNKLGITLSLGEQSYDVYKRWFDAGAHRYLLRIESSNPELYRKLHPADHNFERRLKCLRDIKKAGYQTGTGVMQGLPGQSMQDLVNDILFFEKEDVDMLGMGPYIVHNSTPLAAKVKDFDGARQFQLGLKMIALCRIYLKDINIAATTALQALHPEGRELGLLAGGNVIMPNITDTEYRDSYKLYEDKPCCDENAQSSKDNLEKKIKEIGEVIAYSEWGDSKHFFKRKASDQ